MASNEINERIDRAKNTTKRIAKRTLWLVLIASLFLGVGYYFYRNFTISEGTRTGILYKISKKGYVFKTYEGELQLAGAQMMTTESVWKFSAESQALYDQIESLQDKTVRCHYKEKQQAFPWQGDTNYIVWKVDVVEE